MKRFGLSVILPLLLLSCGEDPKRKRKDIVIIQNDDGTISRGDGNSVPGEGSSASEEGSETTPPGENGAGGEEVDGATFFSETVLPTFEEKNCALCHADPRENPPIQGPLSIFSYDAMLSLLADNSLFDKIQNLIPHGGGDQCEGDIEQSPCKEVLEWWDAEFASDPEKAQDRPVKLLGEIRLVSVQGTITGWAYDPDAPDANVGVKVYFDGDQATGTLVAETSANLAGFDNNLSGNHAFQTPLPLELIDNSEHNLYVYATIGGEDVLLKGSPYAYTAFAKADGGLDFYNNNVRGNLNACTNCHTFDYNAHWASLVNPSPAEGGTATNNLLFNKVSGATNHAGGTFCAAGNGSPCDQFRSWWELEFQ